MKFFGKLLGVILHPVVLVLTGVFIIVQGATGRVDEAIYWTILSSFFAFVIGAFVFIGVKKGFFNNFDVSNRKQRIILYPFAILVISLFAIYVYIVKGPSILISVSAFFVVSLAILDLVNKKIKASIHVASVAALSTGFILIYGLNYLLILLLIPLSAYARVAAKRHTVREVIVGAFFGIFLTLAGVYVVKLISFI